MSRRGSWPGRIAIVLVLAAGVAGTQSQTTGEGDDSLHVGRGNPEWVVIMPGKTPGLLATLGNQGVVSLGPGGIVRDRLVFDDPLIEAVTVAVSAEGGAKSGASLLVAAAGEPGSRILLSTMDPESGVFLRTPWQSRALSFDHPVSHLCFARDPYDDSRYLLAGGEHGVLTQYRVLTDGNGAITLRKVRSIAIGGETTDCAADDAAGAVFVVEPDTGLWRIRTDPEAEPLRKPVAFVKPFGTLGEPVSVFIVTYRDRNYPVVTDLEAGAFLRLGPRGSISTRLGFDQYEFSGSVEQAAAGRFPLAGQLRDVAAVTIEGKSGGGEIRVVPIESLGVLPAPGAGTGATGPGRAALVYPRVETFPVRSAGDAADDPAIWVHPEEPALSLILATDKQSGLAVYDLAGNLIQLLPHGRLNNVDVRRGFSAGVGPEYIVTATDRTRKAIAIYGFDARSRRVERVEARVIPAGFHNPYGLCMYRDPASGELYVIATSSDGWLQQWRLSPTAAGSVDAEPVRRLRVGTAAEGCVADDEAGLLFVAEEDVAVWRYAARPDAGNERVAVAPVQPDGKLSDDIEGLGLYRTAAGGFLVASSQGSDSFAVYDLQPPYTFRGMFRIRANVPAGIDGASETDGLDVTSAALPGFPAGMLVVQDGRNNEPDEAQNFKFVSWTEVAAALGL